MYHCWHELLPQQQGVPSSFGSALHQGWNSEAAEREESGYLGGCCGSRLLPDQRKYASCYETEKRSGGKRSKGKGSDSWSDQNV